MGSGINREDFFQVIYHFTPSRSLIGEIPESDLHHAFTCITVRRTKPMQPAAQGIGNHFRISFLSRPILDNRLKHIDRPAVLLEKP